jgi:predicted ATPase
VYIFHIYSIYTKAVAYADDLLTATRGDLVRAMENYANAELSKIEG